MNPGAMVQIPGYQIPSFRTQVAVDRGVHQKIMLVTWGGLGDQICAEPTLRFAVKTFKGCEIYLASEHPYLFEHLPFAKVFNLKESQPIWDDYLTFNTIRPTSDLTWEFMSHMLVNCVDYPSLCAFRCMLPVGEKPVVLTPSDAAVATAEVHLTRDNPRGQPLVAVHAGRHWQSKTFPKAWWDAVLRRLIELGTKPVLIGASTDDNRSTVDVNPEGCIDLRNALSVMESVALLHRVPALVTNDSAPLHMAVAGDAWIAFVATCKHPDYITHWRINEGLQAEWSWRMRNFGTGGVWDHIDYCPNKEQNVEAENVGDLLETFLPTPELIAGWAAAKAKGAGLGLYA